VRPQEGPPGGLEFVQDLLWGIAADRQAMIPPGRNECLEYLNKLAEARRALNLLL
jgi:hypothetical protein